MLENGMSSAIAKDYTGTLLRRFLVKNLCVVNYFGDVLAASRISKLTQKLRKPIT